MPALILILKIWALDKCIAFFVHFQRVYLHYVHTYPDTAVDKTMADEAEMSDDSVETESDMEKVFSKLDEAYGQSWRMYASYKVKWFNILNIYFSSKKQCISFEISWCHQLF